MSRVAGAPQFIGPKCVETTDVQLTRQCQEPLLSFLGARDGLTMDMELAGRNITIVKNGRYFLGDAI